MPAPSSLKWSVLAVLAALAFWPPSGEAESPEAQPGSRASDVGQSAYAAGRFLDALRLWRPLAEAGDPRAAFGLGLHYDLGEGVGQDAAAARHWYRRAAEAGHVLAEFNLAIMLDSGVGAPRDAAEAAVWCASAAAHAYPRPEYNLAQLYETGDGVPRNLDMAEAWYAAAADHGLAAAARKLRSIRAPRGTAALPPAQARTLRAAIPTGPPVTRLDAKGETAAAELSFAAPAQALPVEFFVEVLAVESPRPRIAFGGYSKVSAILVELPRAPMHYAWRVYTVAASIPDYVASPWRYFSVR